MIRLIVPLPQIGRIVPAGCIIDAPEPLEEKLIRQGRAEKVEPNADERASVDEVEKPVRRRRKSASDKEV